MTLEIISNAKCFGGMQGVFKHSSSSTQCDMTFAVFVPPQAATKACPVLWYLSGLTCSHANVMDKGEYRRAAAHYGIIIVCPDTSPRGDGVPDEAENWQMGQGAGFYLNATQAPWSTHYNMESYIVSELPEIIAQNFNVDMTRQAITGHSMGGHGALTLALKNSNRYKSCSAFAPIVQPSHAEWSSNAFRQYLGDDMAAWRQYDACALIEDGARFPEFLVDQGTSDGFLDSGLRPWFLEQACKAADIPLLLRMQEGYDHSYNFISTFMEEHLSWHAERLNG
jgi:S-formylglutathione hydrolase